MILETASRAPETRVSSRESPTDAPPRQWPRAQKWYRPTPGRPTARPSSPGRRCPSRTRARAGSAWPASRPEASVGRRRRGSSAGRTRSMCRGNRRRGARCCPPARVWPTSSASRPQSVGSLQTNRHAPSVAYTPRPQQPSCAVRGGYACSMCVQNHDMAGASMCVELVRGACAWSLCVELVRGACAWSLCVELVRGES